MRQGAWRHLSDAFRKTDRPRDVLNCVGVIVLRFGLAHAELGSCDDKIAMLAERIK